MNSKEITIEHKYVQGLFDGHPHLAKEMSTAFDQLTTEGQLLDLMTPEGVFIARGYYGRQNKGYGWVLTMDQAEPIDLDFFIEKIKVAEQKRTALSHDPTTNAFRLFNGEGDGIGGLTIDRYADYLLVTWYSEGIYQFKSVIIAAIEAVLTSRGIYEKKRFDQGGKYISGDDFVRGERATFPLVIQENGVAFNVNLNDGPMTGIFLDQREVREKIRTDYSAGRTVLNTFSYTGAFSVYAALGGAEKTTSVDLANRSLPLTIDQLKVNAIDESMHEIRVIDVFNYFDYAVKKALQFDVVILDPPSFARSKKRVFSVQKDYVKLLEQAIDITATSGVIVASTNYSGFDMRKFKQFIDQAFNKKGSRYKIVETFRQPKDFPFHQQFAESRYLKVVFVEKLS